MVDIRLPVVSGTGQIIGSYSFATGENIGANGANHVADIASSTLDQSSFTMTLADGDNTLNPGDTVGFSFQDADGNAITVENATIQLSSGGSTSEDILQGVMTAVGTDQNGNEIAVLVDFNRGSSITAGETFASTDSAVTGTAGTDIAIDSSINFIYMGNFPDTDPNESDTNSENANSLINITATAGDGLKLVNIQPIDAAGTVATGIRDNDQNGTLDGGDYSIYTSPTTGEVVDATADSSMVWDAAVLVRGETTPRTISVLVVQMDNGDTFVTDLTNNGTLDNLDIESIRLVRPTNTNSAGYLDNQSVDNTVVCFTKTVPITTPTGDVAAGDLCVGDIVLTVDHGPQQIRWIERTHFDSIDFALNPKLYPVRIRQGSLGSGLPAEDILVSRQHRFLVSSQIVREMFGTAEVLIPAIKLVGLPGIEVATDITDVTYVHFLFDRHEMVFAAGAPTESLFTGPETMKTISDAARQEIFTLFPELEEADNNAVPVRELIKNKAAKSLIAHHVKNTHPLIENNLYSRTDLQ